MSQPMAEQAGPATTKNSVSSNSDRIGSRKWIDRVEFIRLLQQSLHRLGYSEVASKLEQQSGIQMQPVFATSFQEAVLAGKWQDALNLLPELVSGEAAQKEAHFLILRQKYNEMLDAKDQVGALQCLRMELAPLNVNLKDLHVLAGLLLSIRKPPKEEGQAEAARAAQRLAVLEDVHRLLRPSLIIPDGRLEHLVEQALEAQVANCQYHNVSGRHLSLFTDYKAGREQLPNQTVQVLENHADEVWHVAFSHSGHMLASASKDKTAIVWTVDNHGRCTHLHTLSAHNAELTYVAWSPDDSMLLTCGNCGTCAVWSVASATCLLKFTEHDKCVVAGAWFPDGERVVTGGHDHKTIIWSSKSGQVLRIFTGLRINDLTVTSDGAYLVCVSSEKAIRLHRLADDAKLDVQTESSVTSLALSEDSEQLLINFSCHTINLWSMHNLQQRLAAKADSQRSSLHPSGSRYTSGDYKTEEEPLAEYRRGVSDNHGRFVVRSSFGGSRGSFVVSGSEDSQVYLWHKDSGDQLEVMPGHSGTVNAVSWSTARPHILASASDDHTIRIWLAAAALEMNSK